MMTIVVDVLFYDLFRIIEVEREINNTICGTKFRCRLVRPKLQKVMRGKSCRLCFVSAV